MDDSNENIILENVAVIAEHNNTDDEMVIVYGDHFDDNNQVEIQTEHVEDDNIEINQNITPDVNDIIDNAVANFADPVIND